MYLTDYHTHTKLSPDGSVPLAEMAEAAVAAGLNELCITDHCDLLELYGEPVDHYDWPPALEQYAAVAPRYAGKLTIRLGLEFGMAHLNPEASRAILDRPELDFVLGSIHNLCPQKGGTDFYYVDYPDPAACYAALDDYFASMAQLAVTDFYDVLSHIIYPLRYMDHPISLDRYHDVLDGIFRAAAERGRGIEINTWRGRTLKEWLPVLKQFKARGGEIVTIGSDAHTTDGVGKGCEQACQLLAEAEFRYLATYEKRKPVFHTL